jgi:hypothetical protein
VVGKAARLSASSSRLSRDDAVVRVLRGSALRHRSSNSTSAIAASGSSLSRLVRNATQPRKNFGHGGTAISGAMGSGSRLHSCG